MPARVHTLVLPSNITVRINDKRVALSPHVFFAHKSQPLPGIIGLNRGVIGVTQKRKVQMMLVSKLFVRLYRVFAYPNDCRQLFYVGTSVAETAGLFGATRRVILWVKVQNQPLTSVIT